MIQDTQKADAQIREYPDPHEGNRPVPYWMIAIVALVFTWAIGYIFIAHPDGEAALGDARTKGNLMVRTGAGTVDGAQIFAAQCVACHQAGGTGLAGVFPPLAASEWVLAKEAVPITILLHGISGKLSVKNTAYNGAMPAFGAKLGDSEIAAVLTYVRTSFGNSAGKVDAAMVQAVRAASKDRTSPWNGDDELGKLK